MIHIKGSKEGGSHLQAGRLQGGPPIARLPARAVDYGQSPYRGAFGQTTLATRGNRTRPGLSLARVTSCGHDAHRQAS
ncbi:hypothetical protein B296_00028346 [Ensete ventricosum]|uniref:Uncharacterized protein n=1 Tax=Ensete ventricosum TaxID=4639 RepID=A0A427A8Y9_ENSVE|nr:hypothetical protein B296_00028346 [Ensete ventricosum]